MDTDNKVLTRAKHGVISGTLAGFADYYNLNCSGLRFVFFILLFCGFGFIMYLVLWMSIPRYSAREKLLAEKVTRN